MNRSDRLNVLFAQFDKCAQQFCDDTQALFCQVCSEYKGERLAENLKYRLAKIYYHTFDVEFRYTAHGVLSVVNSIVDCTVYLDKTDGAVGIPLPLLMDYCNVDTATPLCIPCISNALGMRQAFACIGGELTSLLPQIARIGADSAEKAGILQRLYEEVTFLYDIKDIHNDNLDINALCADFFTLRFSTDAFLNHIKGNDARAVKQLKKVKKLSGYEQRMLRLWTGTEQSNQPELSAVVENLQMYNQSGVQKSDHREFLVCFLAWIILTPLIAVVYLGMFVLVMYFEGSSSIYLMGPIHNFPYCICAAFITAIGVSYFTRFWFYKWMFKKDFERFCELDHIQNGGGADKFMKGFLTVLVTGSLICCVLFVKLNLNFLQDGFYDNREFFSLKGTFYSYDEIERVYYKPDRVNGLGETLEFPSYVLVMENGEQIDLYEFDEIEAYETVLLAHLESQGVKIER